MTSVQAEFEDVEVTCTDPLCDKFQKFHVDYKDFDDDKPDPIHQAGFTTNEIGDEVSIERFEHDRFWSVLVEPNANHLEMTTSRVREFVKRALLAADRCDEMNATR
jgi:hypothetical protein